MKRGAEGFDRGVPPSAGAIRPFEFPQVTSFELASGLSLRVASMPALPVVSACLVLDAGEGTVDPTQAGLSVLTGDALQAGTAHRSGAELAEAMESLGAGLTVATGWDATVLSLSCLSERLDDAGRLMAEVAQEPSFEENEFGTYRQQRLASIDQRRMDPRSLADDSAARLIYAGVAPYGRPVGGTKATIQALTREDSLAFAGGHYRPSGGGLVVVGDVEPEAVRALAESLFGVRAGSPPDRRTLRVEPRSESRSVHIVHRPGAVQSEIRVGHVGQARDSEDYFPLAVLNTVLGGAFTSRLNLNLRERHGFTYGVRSQFAFRRHAGPFSISTAVATEVTAPAVREVMAELEGIVDGGLTEEEAQAARDYIIGVFPLRLETTAQVASRINELIIHDLPDDYYASYRERIAAVTREDADAAARRAIRPDEAAVVVVGDADRVRSELEALALGPVEVHEPSDLVS